nr:RNA degradosome polyphosphate kinase [Actinomyces trachealis]
MTSSDANTTPDLPDASSSADNLPDQRIDVAGDWLGAYERAVKQVRSPRGAEVDTAGDAPAVAPETVSPETASPEAELSTDLHSDALDGVAATAESTATPTFTESLSDELVEEEHIIESFDPRDFTDDSGPQYEDEDFEEPNREDDAVREVAGPSPLTSLGAPTPASSTPATSRNPRPILADSALDDEPFNPRLAFSGGGSLIVPGRPVVFSRASARAQITAADGAASIDDVLAAASAGLEVQAPHQEAPKATRPSFALAEGLPADSDAAETCEEDVAELYAPAAATQGTAPSMLTSDGVAEPTGAPGTTDLPGAPAPLGAPAVDAVEVPAIVDAASDAPTTTGTSPAVVASTTSPAAHTDPPPLPPLDSFKQRFTDRELTWMDFNERVLEQAEDPDLPLLERAWFAAIFSSNLDEFYMVRVAGLKRRIAAGITPVRASGLNGHQVLARLTERAQELTARQAALVRDDIRPALASHGIMIVGWEDLDTEQSDRLTRYFRNQIYPVLTPLAVDPSHPFPYISGLSLNLAVIVRNPQSGKEHFARVKVPQSLPRLIPVPVLEGSSEVQGQVFIPLEVVIAQHLDHLFPGMEVIEHHTFRVTRNENLEVEEDDAENLLKAMEKELERRRFGAVVRVEVEDTISSFARRYLVRALGLNDSDVFALPAPLDLKCMNILHDLDVPELKYPRFVPVTAAGLAAHESATAGDIFAEVREHDVLLHHPYDSFSTSVQEFIAQAAADPAVLAIKQTLYRTSGDSPIVDALIEAADAGKQVVAIVEIKARFDEENNIGWARKLERAGVHVVYGMVGLKTHCKLSLVVRQEADGLRRYCHVGTGNYHPKTARGYEDLGLLTADRAVAQDLTTLFNQLSGYAPRARFRRLLVAPRSLRDGLLELIEQEIANKQAGKDAWVRIKVNSIIDERLIDALYRASRAGVPVDIVVRGICGIRAGVPGLSENIKVRSILGRYLEHSRIYAFCNDGDTTLYIGSADLMHRNLDRRVEALVRLTDPAMIRELERLVTHAASDAVSSWHLEPDGSWKRVSRDANGQSLEDIQVTLMSQARARVADAR